MTTVARDQQTFPSRSHAAGRVVVGIDDAPASLAALRLAAHEAGYRGTSVLALHVWHYPATWGVAWSFTPVWPEDGAPDPSMMAELQKTVDDVLAERAAAGEAYVAITADVVRGESVSALHEAADGASLLVLGARHHNRFVGSVSLACTAHSTCPVLIVPDGVAHSRGAADPDGAADTVPVPTHRSGALPEVLTLPPDRIDRADFGTTPAAPLTPATRGTMQQL